MCALAACPPAMAWPRAAVAHPPCRGPRLPRAARCPPWRRWQCLTCRARTGEHVVPVPDRCRYQRYRRVARKQWRYAYSLIMLDDQKEALASYAAVSSLEQPTAPRQCERGNATGIGHCFFYPLYMHMCMASQTGHFGVCLLQGSDGKAFLSITTTAL